MKSRLTIPKAKVKEIANRFFPEKDRGLVVRELTETLKRAEKYRLMSGLIYHPKDGRLVKKVFVGIQWVQQKNRRRKTLIYHPRKDHGNPGSPFMDYLVAKLGDIFWRFTGEKPKLANTDNPLSKFEIFVGNILMPYIGMSDCRGRIRKYLKKIKEQ